MQRINGRKAPGGLEEVAEEKVRQGTGALGTLGPLRTEKKPRADRAALKTSLKRWVFT